MSRYGKSHFGIVVRIPPNYLLGTRLPLIVDAFCNPNQKKDRPRTVFLKSLK